MYLKSLALGIEGKPGVEVDMVNLGAKKKEMPWPRGLGRQIICDSGRTLCGGVGSLL